MKGVNVGVVVVAGICALMGMFALVCNDDEGAGGREPGTVDVLDVRVDTVVRIVEREAVRVVFSPVPVKSGAERSVVDTIWITADSARLDTLAEQDFVAMADTVAGRDTVRVIDSIRVRARAGPIALVSLRTRIAVTSAPDSVAEVTRELVIRETRYRSRPWLETVGIFSGGAVVGVLGFIIVRELKKE